MCSNEQSEFLEFFMIDFFSKRKDFRSDAAR